HSSGKRKCATKNGVMIVEGLLVLCDKTRLERVSVLNQRTFAGRGRTSRRSFLADAAMRGLAVLCSTKIAPSITRAAEKGGGDSQPGSEEDLIYHSASQLARLIRSRSVSSEELVRAYLSRIAEVNPKLNAVCQIDEKGALAAAREADTALK